MQGEQATIWKMPSGPINAFSNYYCDLGQTLSGLPCTKEPRLSSCCLVQRPQLTHVALSLVQATVNHCCATMSENGTKVSADLSTIAQIGEVFWIIGLNDSLK